jgi:hypothetical protein
MNAARIAQLPSDLQAPLEIFTDTLSASLGPELQSLAAYGPVAAGDYMADFTPVNVLIVPRAVTVSLLKQLVAPLREARQSCRLVPFIMTRNDLIASSDVFPIKFRMMKECHVLLAGTDVLGEVEVADTHLRLRCEQELKNLVLRLRLRYLEAQGDVMRLRNVAIMTSQAAIDPLRVMVSLKSGKVPDRIELVAAARESCGLDLATLDEIKKVLRTPKPAMDDLELAYGQLMDTIEAAARHADSM